ncbi:surface protease GP63, partial [Trypanosoma rangeli]
ATGVLSPVKGATVREDEYPEATKLHAERFLPKPVVGKRTVPRASGGPFQHFTVPTAHNLGGAIGADMALLRCCWAVPMRYFGVGEHVRATLSDLGRSVGAM